MDTYGIPSDLVVLIFFTIMKIHHSLFLNSQFKTHILHILLIHTTISFQISMIAKACFTFFSTYCKVSLITTLYYNRYSKEVDQICNLIWSFAGIWCHWKDKLSLFSKKFISLSQKSMLFSRKCSPTKT